MVLYSLPAVPGSLKCRAPSLLLRVRGRLTVVTASLSSMLGVPKVLKRSEFQP